MNKLRDRILVTDIAGDAAVLECEIPELVGRVEALGFSGDGGSYRRKILDMNDRRDLVKKLVALGALFSAGRDWSPAEVVALFSEEGVVDEKFLTVAWKGPDDFSIDEHEPKQKIQAGGQPAQM